MVGRAPPAEREPAVGGALAVHDDVPVVGERLPLRQPDPGPGLLGQRRGGHHQRVDRRHRTPLAGQPRRVALGRADHHRCPDHARRGHRRARPQRGHRGALVDAYAPAFHRPGQAPDQLRRVHGGAVRGVRAAAYPLGVAPRGGLAGVEQRQVVVGQPVRVGLRDLGPGPVELGLAACERHGAAGPPVAVDALGGGDPAHLADRVVHGPLHGQCPVPAVPPGQRRQRGGEQRRAPAAVAPGRAVPGDLPLQHDDAQRGVGLGQVPRRPQPGVPGAHDRHVGVRVAGQPGSRCQRFVQAGQPVRQMPVVGHRRQSRDHASVSTPRRICSISSKCCWSAISGGASCTTGSPRSSARQ